MLCFYFSQCFVFFQDLSSIYGLSRIVLRLPLFWYLIWFHMVRKYTLYGFTSFKFVRFALWPKLWLILKHQIFRNSGALPTACYFSLPPSAIAHMACLSQAENRTPEQASESLWLSDRLDLESPACLDQEPGSSSLEALSSMTLPMTRDWAHNEVRLGLGGDRVVASPGPVSLHPYLFLMRWWMRRGNSDA